MVTICFTEISMKFDIFGYTFKVGKQKDELYMLGADAKREQVWQKIKNGLDHMNQYQLDYTEYRLQKVSGVSINSIKKYRDRIEEYRAKYSLSLFN